MTMGNGMTTGMDRRTLLKRGAGMIAASWILPRIGLKAASDRIAVASIGVGIMGNGNLRRMLSNPDLQVVAVCDVDEWRLNDARDTVETAYAAATRQPWYVNRQRVIGTAMSASTYK